MNNNVAFAQRTPCPAAGIRTPGTDRLPFARRLVVFLLASFVTVPVFGHSLELTRTLVLLRGDGSYQVDMTCDLDALALGASPMADSAELAAAISALSPDELAQKTQALRRYFERRVRVRFDGTPVKPQVSFPDGLAVLSGTDEPTILGLIARLEGRIPADSRAISFSASRSFPAVHLTVLNAESLSGERQILEPGARSAPVLLEAVPEAAETTSHVRLETAGRYLALGFWHIVPEGLDHILFVLGLFLLSAHWRPLLWQVSAFTLAHTLTLALSTYGLVQLPAEIVEPLIALSIVYVAVENLLTRDLKPWRPVVVFVFGLLHGLGFAGVLGELGLPAQDRLAALLAFNVGVELGQLSVIVVAFAAVGWLRQRPWYRARIVIPASIVIALTGLTWAIQRTLGG